MSRSSSRLAYKATEHQLTHPDDTASPAPSASATPARKSRTTAAAAAATPSTPAATLAQPDDEGDDDDEDAAAAPALAAIAAASGSSSSARPRNTPISASGRRLHNRAEEGNLWDAEMDRVLFAGMALIPALGRRTVWLGDDSYGRNGLLGEYLRRQTGKIRNRTQVASHLAVMRKNRPNDQQLADLINGHPLAADALATTNWSELLGPDLHPTSVSTAKAENDRVKRHRDEVVALQKARRGSSASLSNAGSPAAAHVSRSYVSSPGLGPGGASATGSSGNKGRKRGAAGTKRRAGRSSAAARDADDDDLASSDLSELPSSDDEDGAAAAGASASYKKPRVSSRPPASLAGDGFDLAPAGPGSSARQHSRRTSARRSYVPYGALATDGSDDDAHANEDDDDLTLSPARTRRVPPARGSTTPGSGFAPPKQPASLPGAGAGASAPPAPMFAAPAPGPFGSPSSTSAAGAAPADITSASIPAASTASASSSSFAAPPPPKSASAAMDLDDEHADADESKPVVVVGVPAPSTRAAPAAGESASTSTLDELSRVAAAAAAAAVDEPAQADSKVHVAALLEESEREALEAARARAREAGFGEVEAGELELGEEGEEGEGGERGFFGSVRKGLWKLVGL